jgi:uncharacterized lipoprotein YddW (UPF0748 family)
MFKIKSLTLLLSLFLISTGCRHLKLFDSKKPADPHPKIEREFRAAWVATVANINWPSAPGIPVDQQKEEALKLLDLLKDTHFNAVIFQVRPQGDALYKSELEPWSYYLTGKQGEAPDPYYDPLEFWVKEAHKRGLELHVWLNPYRAHHVVGGPISEQSVVKTKSDLVVPLESGYWWFDPSLKGTQDHSHAVVMDIVKRYDIDGVHFDDYFYPYPSYNGGEDFPDDNSWNAYKANGGKLSRADWRRNSVDTFIKRVYTSIKKEKPYVKFGLSPFGIWRPQNPPSIRGFDQYNELYADARKWLKEGWVDYFTPQLYWPINQIPQSFPVLLGWWEEQNFSKRHLWPGISIGRFKGEKQVDEVINEIMVTRGMLPKAPGTVHWSIQPLVESDTLQQALLNGPYARRALIPSMNWVRHKTPAAPEIQLHTNRKHVSLSVPKDMDEFSNWIVYTKYDNLWETHMVSRLKTEFELPYYRVGPGLGELNWGKISTLQEIQVTYVNRLGFESHPFIHSF